MASVTPIRSSEPDISSADKVRDEQTMQAVRLLVGSLSAEKRAILARELAQSELDHEPGPSGVLATIIKFLPRGQTVTAADLRREIADRGVEAEPKEVYNAIGYLARTGKLVRVGYGRYLVNGIEITTPDNLGGEFARNEDVSDDDR